MLYNFLKKLAKVGLTYNFRKIYIHNYDNIPKNVPIIYVINHSNPFLDKILLNVFTESSIRFVNGKQTTPALSPWLMPFLHSSLNKIESEDDRNVQHSAIESLTKNESIVISIPQKNQERRLQQLPDLTADLLIALQNTHPDLEVAVVPCVFNYSNTQSFRSDVSLAFGHPILKNTFDFQRPIQILKQKVNEKVLESFHKYFVQVDKPEDDQLVETMWPILANTTFDESAAAIVHNTSSFSSVKKAVGVYNELRISKKKEVETDLISYLTLLRDEKLNDFGIAYPEHGKTYNGVVLWAVGVFAIFGFILNYSPAYLANSLAKSRAKQEVQFSSYRFDIGNLVYIIYLLIWLVILWFGISWLGLILLPLFPLSGKLFLQWYEKYRFWKLSVATKSISDERLRQIQKARKRLLKHFNL